MPSLKNKSVSTTDLCTWLNTKLNVAAFNDYCPNGLQVQGATSVSHIIAGVTASEALIDIAIERGAQALLVHHGWFWKSDDPCVTGIRRQRLCKLLAHNINLLAYHLPLDAHPVLGNNAQLAKLLSLTQTHHAGHYDLICLGKSTRYKSLEDLSARIASQLKRDPLVIGQAKKKIKNIAWCTGAAQNMFQQAIDAHADVFITGEISEQTVHLARESGVAFISAGHHATERYGVKALAQALSDQFKIKADFVDLENPV
jgi:dinuclear metal center YbgI/SA1388 family protein